MLSAPWDSANNALTSNPFVKGDSKIKGLIDHATLALNVGKKTSSGMTHKAMRSKHY